jgi:hypothetical protein
MEGQGYLVMPAMGAEQTLEAFRRACQAPDFMDDMDARERIGRGVTP